MNVSFADESEVGRDARMEALKQLLVVLCTDAMPGIHTYSPLISIALKQRRHCETT